MNFAHLSTAGIKRIEILRGAPSALWGSNAISGVINLISRKGGRSSLTHKSGSNQRHETTLQVATESEDFSMQTSAHHFQTRGREHLADRFGAGRLPEQHPAMGRAVAPFG